MHLVITDQHGAVQQARRLSPTEVMDAEAFAQRYAAAMDQELGCTCLPIPDGCGDFRVEFRPRRDNPAHVYASQEFYFASGADCY